ncbi:hypothetical protein LZC95_50430 [Pendulispora brunnea]|uniref:Uncharacterized protein n=1 Tax=Pendulispora brunnea TaxID=2905690 RepID=A0ABZ2K962_9BACT
MNEVIQRLFRDLAARVPAAGEQRENFFRALSNADTALQQIFIQYPSVEDGGARNAAYHDVQQVVAHPLYPHSPFEPAGHFGDDVVYEAEIVRLWAKVECALATSVAGRASLPDSGGPE